MFGVQGQIGFKLLDENGEPYGVPNVNNKPRVSAMPVGWDIAEGNLTDHRPIRVLGQNSDVDNVREDCITQGGTYIFPPTPQQLEIVSTSINDTSVGTGVQQIEIHYLDTNYVEYDEHITLNGTTPVLTIATNILRVNGMHAIAVGSNGVAVGTINLRTVGGVGNTYAQIKTGLNTMLQSVYTVPATMNFMITDFTTGTGSQAGSRYCEFLLMATAHDDEGTVEYLDGVFHVWDIIAGQDATFQRIYIIPILFPPKTDIKISVMSDSGTANAVATGAVNGWIEPV